VTRQILAILVLLPAVLLIALAERIYPGSFDLLLDAYIKTLGAAAKGKT
jgi:hypothetical protein